MCLSILNSPVPQVLEAQKLLANEIYNLRTQNTTPVIIYLRQRTTCYSKYTKYKTTPVLHLIEDEGLNVDRPRLLGTINLRLLNHDLQGTFGFAEGEDDFGEKILSLQENINKEYINKEQGIMASSKPIETNTT